MKNSNITFTEFQNAFHNMNRQDNFSYEGLKALYEYLADLESDLDTEIELDVIALCCEYSEHDLPSLIQEYGENIDAEELIENGDGVIEPLMQYLENNTTVIPVGKSDYIIQDF